MHSRWFVSLATALLGLAGCSRSSPPASPAAGTLDSGSAQITLAFRSLGTTHEVACQFIQSLTHITIRNGGSHVTVYVNNTKGLTADSVSFNDVGGFTGSYQRDLQGSAEVNMVSQTYTITGSAAGFEAENPAARTTASFTVKAAC
jgi:ipoprotein LpqH